LTPRTYAPGHRVAWRGGETPLQGVVRKVFTDRVERTRQGTHVVRDSGADDPAYLIEQDDGARVLKTHSQLTRL